MFSAFTESSSPIYIGYLSMLKCCHTIQFLSLFLILYAFTIVHEIDGEKKSEQRFCDNR